MEDLQGEVDNGAKVGAASSLPAHLESDQKLVNNINFFQLLFRPFKYHIYIYIF